jgi:hypothetical protein
MNEDIIICLGCGAEIIRPDLYYENEYGCFHIDCWDNYEDEEDEDSE